MGLPASFTPGARYVLTVTLTHPELRVGGFQLAARFAEGEAAGRQAGTFRATDDRVRIVIPEDGGVAYVSHTEAGTAPVAGDTARWRVEWTAPGPGVGRVAVVVHVAANAGNDDASELGDRIYTGPVLKVQSRLR